MYVSLVLFVFLFVLDVDLLAHIDDLVPFFAVSLRRALAAAPSELWRTFAWLKHYNCLLHVDETVTVAKVWLIQTPPEVISGEQK